MAALCRLASNAGHRGRNIWAAAAKAWEGTSNVTYPAPWHRQKSSERDIGAGYATNHARSFFPFTSPEPSRPTRRNDYGVDTLERDEESSEDELRSRPFKKNELVSVVPDVDVQSKPPGQVETSAVDKGANVATSALDNVGSVLTKTALEVELDVSLQELTIEKLVLKDLGLVLTIKTKPPPPPGTPPQPEEPDTRKRKARPGDHAAAKEAQPSDSKPSQ